MNRASNAHSEASGNGVRIKKVRTPRAMRHFLELPYRLYKNDSLWVPPPRRDMRELFDRKRHPFHEHAQVDYFLAFHDRRCVGRIAAIENFAHNTFHGEHIGFFGFLDAEEKEDVFHALLRAAERWAAERGLTSLRGPCSFSTNEECGVLVSGFSNPPYLMSPWNPESYPGLIEAAGYGKARDLYSYWSNVHNYEPRMERMAEMVKKRFESRGDSLVIRPVDPKHFAEDLEKIRQVYNGAWEKNWGFVPMTRKEFDHLASQLKPLLVPDLAILLEVNGEPSGFSLALPDYNVALRHMEGRMGPRQLALFLLLRRQIKQIRVLTMGVVEKYRNRGLEALLVGETVKNSTGLGYSASELGWILEDNELMNRELLRLGAQHYKTHRIYQKDLAPRQ